MLRVLGPIVIDDGTSLTAQVGKRGRVLAVLAARSPDVVTADLLEEVVWDGAPPPSARNAIQVYVSALRRQGVDVLTTGAGYHIFATGETLDAKAFEQLVRAASTDPNHGSRIPLMEQALSLWRGRAFEPHQTLEPVRPVAVYLEQMRLEAEDMLTDARLEVGTDIGIVESIRQLVDEEPLREHRWGQLMLGLYRNQRQADALRTYQDAARVLGDELGIEPGPKLQLLEEQILLHDRALDGSAALPAHVPTWPTQLFGRQESVDEIISLLDRSRVVTVTGLGGIGKTRIAAAVATRIAPRFSDGVVYVDLGNLSRAGDVRSFFAERAGLSGGAGSSMTGSAPSVAHAVRDLRILVVLDNCEHLPNSVADLVSSDLLTAPGIRVLATSRLPLGVYGETLIPVGPLDIDGAGVHLFEAAAARAQRQFTLLSSDTASARRVCEALGGIPLLIELAASTLGDRSLEALVDQLARTEGGPIDQTMVDDTIGWALEQVPEPARLAAAALSVFRGGWKAGNGVTILEKLGVDDPTEAVGNLTRASLIQFDYAADRYSMLEPVIRAAQHGDPSTAGHARDLHTSVFVALAIEALPHVNGYDQNRWLDELQAEHDNFRAMIDRALAEGNPDVLPALASLAFVWFRRFRQGEAAEWFERIEDVFDLTVEEQPLTAIQSGHAAMWAGDPQKATSRIDLIEPLVVELGSPFLLGRLHHSRGNIAGWGFGSPAASLHHFELARDVMAPTGDPLAVVAALSEAYMAVRCGDNERMSGLLPIVSRLSTELAPAFASMGEDQVRGLLALYEDQGKEAVRLLTRSVQKLEELRMISLRGPLLVPLAWSRLVVGDHDQARAAATEAHTTVTRDNAGWRVGEANAAMGGVAMAEGDVMAAHRWFSLAFEAARVAPEADILVWASWGLVATAPWRSADHRQLFAQSVQRLADDHSIVLPTAVADFLGLSWFEAARDVATANSLNQMRKEGVDV
ncbi:MAG: hypothetical protein GY720_05625 [bacterium]|nr:hypothetical protein [bacterium]